ncbi:hypothetical protein A3C21_00905 [Candidatus Kaiserbacteria bacterium RIFCSPHIGHO2_02_FULL_59_21]|uniref:Uncharacterized protein n=1 Tax=Candidatus Kaiserbacteria bacterium RIFCSPHIGHO2_02_FULL_59_21 TaxID=1798500 RepID=A0A1F6E354_9BACT|nr:MAG: hypothetical protein A2766_03350 [Candidatus Kaiserbacteria bacterium RIFCSPHIGHO2_01_FULL_58_22]OGG67642.1 MAG: hypothetical protein A3C21_00905 [Candidatus Kaiserbacteria bacterium RIFCSPHIGHO2_02_FULL_59_21]OGG79919.1 MAG: hypothetical protein A2952_02310 [Candidatus Kaiserbacteria bacterium RIFCSPLOWO2_01_FULL_59_34]OGG86547.1 MAG: hypothetical protein A3I47_02600 [Candidatus Kaiserbacteria bacterium RIFCSPLOWO2_02_FULL_59_19]
MAEIHLEKILKESEYVRRGFRDVITETIQKLAPDASFSDQQLLKIVREKIASDPYLRGWVEIPDEYVKVDAK